MDDNRYCGHCPLDIIKVVNIVVHGAVELRSSPWILSRQWGIAADVSTTAAPCVLMLHWELQGHKLPTHIQARQ